MRYEQHGAWLTIDAHVDYARELKSRLTHVRQRVDVKNPARGHRRGQQRLAYLIIYLSSVLSVSTSTSSLFLKFPVSELTRTSVAAIL